MSNKEILTHYITNTTSELDDLTQLLFNFQWHQVLQDRNQKDQTMYLLDSLVQNSHELHDRVRLAYDSPQISKTWTIGMLRQEISAEESSWPVRFDFDPEKYVNSFQFHSYRGWYHHLGIDVVDEPTDVKRLIDELDWCLGSVYEGYRGGSYRMYPETPVWSSVEGSSGGRAIVGMRRENNEVILETEEFIFDWVKEFPENYRTS